MCGFMPPGSIGAEATGRRNCAKNNIYEKPPRKLERKRKYV